MDRVRKECVFGPLNSRRLGISLGIDLLPFKTCSMDCIYCECGATTRLTLERKEYFPTELALKNVEKALSSGRKIDYVTFSGVGEPTLDTGFGTIVRYVHKNFPGIRVCMLTNSTTLSVPGVIEDLSECDLVVPSLDGSDPEELRKVNRSAAGVTFEDIVNGLVRLKKVMKGKMWLEIFLAGGINDSPESAERFRKLVSQIGPDKVQLNTLDRPGTEKDVTIPSPEKLAYMAEIIGKAAPVECIGGRADAQRSAGVSDTESYNQRILALLDKGPATLAAISAGLGFSEAQITAHLRRMEKAGLLASEETPAGRFFRPSPKQ